jgi:hypothetical protein
MNECLGETEGSPSKNAARDVMLVADRSDVLTVTVHGKQMAAFSHDPFAIVKALCETEVPT